MIYNNNKGNIGGKIQYSINKQTNLPGMRSQDEQPEIRILCNTETEIRVCNTVSRGKAIEAK